jgi:hypothetical protein
MEHGSVGAAGPEELLRLSAEVAGLDADVADRLAQDRLRAVTDALAHALVDLADGAAAPSVRTPWPARPTTRRPPRVTAGDLDVASCSAMAAALGPVAQAVAASGADPLADRVGRAVELVRSALQELVQDVGLTAAASEEPLAQELTTRLQQHLRQAHLLLTPSAAAGSGRTTGRSGTTVHP